ncbi:MAG: DUF1415 domain-containing protein [Burkholderiaceae bacterium]
MNTLPDSSPQDHAKIVDATREWLVRAVIGLNLCPFAKAVEVKDRIRYVVSDAEGPEGLYQDLTRELLYLQATDAEQVETSLLIHPYALNDFLDYNDFLDVADALIEELQLDGEIQIASFHPQYQFAGTAYDAIENYTNRSPFPMLQLLRESSIEAASDSFPDVSQIYEQNIETLRAMGKSGLEQLGVFTFPNQASAENKLKK